MRARHAVPGSRPAKQAARAAEGASWLSGSRAAQGRAAPPLPLAVVFRPTNEWFPQAGLDLRAKGQSVGQQASVNSQVLTDANTSTKSRRASTRQARAI